MGGNSGPASDTARGPRPGGGFAQVLRNRNFTLLWIGQTISWFGDSLYFVALLWLVQELTGSRAMMGLVAACRTIPTLAGFFAGAFIDRWDRRRVMLLADLGRAALVVTVPLLATAGWLQPWHIPVVAFALASVGIFFYPARQALVPTLVGREGLTTANSLLTLSQQVIFVVGYAAGGILIAAFGTLPLFVIDAVTFVISATAIWSLRLDAQAARLRAVGAEGLADAAPRASIGADVRQGFAFIFGHQMLLYVAPLSVVFNFLFAPISVLLPSWAKDVLGGGADTFGFLQTATTVGLAIGSVFVAVAARRYRRSGLVMGGMLGMSLIVVAMSLVKTIPIAFLVMGGLGVANATVNVLFMTYMQTVVPRELMGRVFGALETVSNVAAPAGQALAGVLGQMVALPLVFGGAGCIMVAISVGYVLTPKLRGALRLMDLDASAPDLAQPVRGAVAAGTSDASDPTDPATS
jgi:DHA3 family macrolide efflux protein-like MFS transporter